jgi:hypothetical protein
VGRSGSSGTGAVRAAGATTGLATTERPTAERATRRTAGRVAAGRTGDAACRVPGTGVAAAGATTGDGIRARLATTR